MTTKKLVSVGRATARTSAAGLLAADRAFARAFGLVLRAFRVQARLTRYELARRIGFGVDEKALVLLERGQQQPTLAVLCAIADGLGIVSEQLITSTLWSMAYRKSRKRAQYRRDRLHCLYRLGMHNGCVGTDEDKTVYESIEDARRAAQRLNAGRRKRQMRPLTALIVYGRISWVNVSTG